jgi:hypothetical protein
MVRPLLATGLAVACFGFAASAQAAVIGINFGSNNGSLASDEQTGVEPQKNWNNAPNNFSGGLDLVDADGAAAGSVSWAGDGVGNVTASPTTPIGKLLNGYLHGDSDTANGSRIGVEIRVEDLPDSVVAGGYDLILYWESTNAGVNLGDRTVAIDFGSDGIVEREVNYTNVTNGAESLTSFVEGVNYIRISAADLNRDIDGFSLRLTKAASEAAISERGLISALQIVPVPEPASAAVVGVGALLAASRNRSE